MAGRTGRCGIGNHGHKKDIKLSGMGDGSRVYSENLGEDASLLAMRGSGDRNNRNDGKDEKILEMGGPRNQNERVEDEQLVEDEEEEEMKVEELDEKEQIKKYKKDQSRSHFAMVYRKFRIGGQSSGRWSAQVTRPVELIGAKLFTCTQYDTDVEAAVAASVVARVFNKAVQRIRGPEYAEKPKRSKPPFKCHDYLIHLTHGSRLPDSLENNDIREFVKPCVELFVKIAKDVENKIQPMPQDPGMAKAIKCYQEAVRYDHENQERKVLPLKQVRRGENKLKRNLVESDGAASGANGPTSHVQRFAMVHRKFRIEGQSGRWSAQVTRPVELIAAKFFTCTEYDTDVEAAVAASVVWRVFKKAVQRIRGPEYAEKPKRWKPPFECHDYLIHLTHGSRLPDSFENNDIREFVKPCVELFVKIAKDVENKIQPMPQDPGMAKAIKCYQEAVRYDHEYPERKVPPSKQVRRGENKLKRNLVESDGAASGANGPTSHVRR